MKKFGNCCTEMWKLFYIILGIFRIFLVLGPQYSYIHPDEFFQSCEPIAGDRMSYVVHKTWEFNPAFPIRSMVIWNVICGYPFSILRSLRIMGLIENIDPYYLIALPRLLMCLISFGTDRAMMHAGKYLNINPHLIGCVSASSLITLVFLSRTFTNSLETCFYALLICFVIKYVHVSHLPPPHSQNYGAKSLSSQTDDTTETSSHAKESPNDAKESPSDATRSPSDATGSPSNAKENPSDAKESPSDAKESSSDAKETPSNDKERPSNGPLSDDSDDNEQKVEQTERNEVIEQVLNRRKPSQPMKMIEVCDKEQGEDNSKNESIEENVITTGSISGQTGHQQSGDEYLNSTNDTEVASGSMSRSAHLKTKLSSIIQENERFLQNRQLKLHKINFFLCMIVLGAFWSRPSFVAFTIAPALYYILQTRIPENKSRLVTMIGTVISCFPVLFNMLIILTLFDASYYGMMSGDNGLSFIEQIKIPPINFLIYNSKPSNLAEHGTHPKYLHIAVNTPLLFGPLLAFVILSFYLIKHIRNNNERRIIALMIACFIVPLLIMSTIPHQEARFLMPLLVPCTIISSYLLYFVQSKLLYTVFFIFLYTHTIIAGLLFGSLHQAGVVPSLLYFNKLKTHGAFNENGANIVYHRTYMPPRHLLQINQWESDMFRVVDLQGTVDDMNLSEQLSSYDKLYLVTPYDVPYVTSLLESRFTVELDVKFYPHLSFEDLPDLESLLAHSLEYDSFERAMMELLTLKVYKLTNKSTIVHMYPSSGSQQNFIENFHSGSYERFTITLPKCPSFSK